MATPATIKAGRLRTRTIAKIRSSGAKVGQHEAEGRRDFGIAFAISTSSLSPINFNRTLWNCGLPRRGWHWRRIVQDRLVQASALSRAKSTNDSSPGFIGVDEDRGRLFNFLF